MDIIQLLNLSLIIIVFAIFALGGAYLAIVLRARKQEEKERNVETVKSVSTFNGITKEEIYNIMEFDEIKDDMIIRKNGEQYVMVIQCKGINYDLLSEDEKLAVESGFVQFLNTLRFPVQLYVQTRSINLRNTIDDYTDRMGNLAADIKKLEEKRKEALKNKNTSLVDRLSFEIRRKQNVLEYGADITDYISRISQNKNVLQQKTYVVVSYYASELGNIANYSKEEISRNVFDEIYTRCQSLIRTLATSQILGRILSSEELAELLYVAYNRDDSELYQLSRALDAEYDALYCTARDVLDKKKEKIDEELELEAVELVTDSIMLADKKRKAEKERKETIREKAIDVIEEYRDQMDDELFEGTKQEILKATDTAESKDVKVTRRKKEVQ